MGKYNSLLKLRGLVSLLLVLALPVAPAKQAKPLSSDAIVQLVPAAKHANLDKTIARLLSNYHYRQNELDDDLSSAVLDAFLENLDPNRSYFLAGDVATFKKRYRITLDNHLQVGNLWPAYEIFNVYQQRLAQQTTRILKQLDQRMDFKIDEFLQLNRKELPWATTQAELDEVWRKRLKHELITLMLASKDLDAARETLKKRYAGRLRRTAQFNSDDVFQIYMNAVSKSFDPHTAYFSPRTSENFNIQMRLSLEGIGAVLRMEDEQVTVVELVPGGPADLSKQIQPEDKIVGVGQGDDKALMDIVGWRLDDVVDLIRGRRGSVVRLQVIPAEAAAGDVGKTVRLVRNTIQLEKQAAKSEIKTPLVNNRKVQVGILTIPTFYSDFVAAQRGEKNYRSTTRDVRRLLRQLEREKIDGLVVDLRRNGGGSLQEAVELTGLFIKEGPIVQMRSVNGGVEVENDPDPTLVYEGPLVVLVDRFSASASEIFAGAIQDYGRGIIIGDHTFGKGTVQTLVDLNRFMPRASSPLGQLKLTIAKFYRVNGSSTQHRGVIPDILLPSPFDSDEVGESAYPRALPWDKITPLRYRSNPHLTDLISELSHQHQTRMATDPVIGEWLEDIKAAKQARENTMVSLLKSQRQVEWDNAKAKQRKRANRRRVAQGLKPLQTGETAPKQEDEPDLLLDESTRIAADMVILLDSPRHRGTLVMTGR